jgi:hypothetical protein
MVSNSLTAGNAESPHWHTSLLDSSTAAVSLGMSGRLLLDAKCDSDGLSKQVEGRQNIGITWRK